MEGEPRTARKRGQAFNGTQTQHTFALVERRSLLIETRSGPALPASTPLFSFCPRPYSSLLLVHVLSQRRPLTHAALSRSLVASSPHPAHVRSTRTHERRRRHLRLSVSPSSRSKNVGEITAVSRRSNALLNQTVFATKLAPLFSSLFQNSGLGNALSRSNPARSALICVDPGVSRPNSQPNSSRKKDLKQRCHSASRRVACVRARVVFQRSFAAVSRARAVFSRSIQTRNAPSVGTRSSRRDGMGKMRAWTGAEGRVRTGVQRRVQRRWRRGEATRNGRAAQRAAKALVTLKMLLGP